MEQSPNQTIALLEQYFFPIRKQWFINTWNSDFSIVLKICNSKSKVKLATLVEGDPKAPFSIAEV